MDYPIQKCLSVKGVSDKAYSKIFGLLKILQLSSLSASKETHYEGLNEWEDPIYGYVHKMLHKFGFHNGKLHQKPDSEFWWTIHNLVTDICYSSSLDTKVSSHHSSAWERNEALIKDLNIIITELKIKEHGA